MTGNEKFHEQCREMNVTQKYRLKNNSDLLYTPDLWSLRTVAQFMRWLFPRATTWFFHNGCNPGMRRTSSVQKSSVFFWLRFWSVFQWYGTWETLRFRYLRRIYRLSPFIDRLVGESSREHPLVLNVVAGLVPELGYVLTENIWICDCNISVWLRTTDDSLHENGLFSVNNLLQMIDQIGSVSTSHMDCIEKKCTLSANHTEENYKNWYVLKFTRHRQLHLNQSHDYCCFF